MFQTMKKFQTMACVAMLTSAIAFTGCKSDQNEPTQKAPSVTTNICISLPANATGGAVRRMPGTTVQVNNGVDDFQGMGNISIIPFGLSKNAVVTGSDTKLGSKLADITDIEATSELANTSKAKKYTNVAVPTGTSAFLFYAESKKTGSKAETGSLTYVEATTTASTTKFELEPIKANASEVTGLAAYTKLIAYVQSVADATDGATPTPKAWKNYTTSDNEGMTELFNEFKKTKNLNSFNIQRMMNDLLATLELTQSTLADNIRAAIKSTDYVTYDGGTKKVTLKSDDNLNNFPACVGLPNGSIAIAYDAESGTFGSSADKDFANRASGSLNVAPINLYTYPASLWYYANTTICTSNESELTALNDATHDWAWVLTQYSASNSSVSPSTRSIALVNPINYAVGRLDVKIKLSGANLEDAALPTSTSVSCNEESKRFTLTGVLVGGQKNVGFDFTPGSYAGGVTSAYTIYDDEMTHVIDVTTTFGDANSTLVLETPASDAEGADVMIAIELLNNTGVDFVGADGVIPAGGKFYMVGKLTAANATTTEKKVFLRDYITTAQLNILDLKHAYNGLPDLRTPSLELGLSVNLSWTAGTTYSIDL